MKAFGYIRVSTDKQAEKGHSIETQTEEIKRYCELKGYVLAEVFADDGYTGRNFKRPAMNELMSRLNECDVVIVHTLTRFGRSLKDTLRHLEILEANNGGLR